MIAAFVSCGGPQTHGGMITIDGRSNIFGAGHSTPPAPGGGGGGLLPPSVDFTAGSGLILTFSSVTGTVNANGPPAGGADGVSSSVDISSFGGISGIIHGNRGFFLMGVFLNGNEPADPAPARLSFSDPEDFTELSPALNQTFFIGDGRTDTGGIVQQFHVPIGATRLFLGFPDAPLFMGPPGGYADNSGSLSAVFTISSVPEPSSWLLLSLGGVTCLCLRCSARSGRHFTSSFRTPSSIEGAVEPRVSEIGSSKR